MCGAGVGTLSAHEMTTCRVSHQQIRPKKGQIVINRPSLGPDSLRDALRATFLGNHRESSGESRFTSLNLSSNSAPEILSSKPFGTSTDLLRKAKMATLMVGTGAHPENVG